MSAQVTRRSAGFTQNRQSAFRVSFTASRDDSCSGHRQYKNCENKRTILKNRLEEQLIGSLVTNLSQASLRSEIQA
jgi:hypothetical protein